jgi:hypothetical protein
MERGNSKHGRQLDEALKHETAGLVTGGHSTHAEEWREPEPVGEDQPTPTALIGGTPAGLEPDEVEARSELARYLGPGCFPAVGGVLLEAAATNGAPELVLNRLRRLPSGDEYVNVAAVWQALGGGVEQRG